MKVLDITVNRKVNCSLNVCKWNQWDQDHLNYTHKGYDESQILYEDDRVILCFHRLKIPLIPFFKIDTLDQKNLKD